MSCLSSWIESCYSLVPSLSMDERVLFILGLIWVAIALVPAVSHNFNLSMLVSTDGSNSFFSAIWSMKPRLIVFCMRILSLMKAMKSSSI